MSDRKEILSFFSGSKRNIWKVHMLCKKKQSDKDPHGITSSSFSYPIDEFRSLRDSKANTCPSGPRFEVYSSLGIWQMDLSLKGTFFYFYSGLYTPS